MVQALGMQPVAQTAVPRRFYGCRVHEYWQHHKHQQHMLLHHTSAARLVLKLKTSTTEQKHPRMCALCNV